MSVWSQGLGRHPRRLKNFWLLVAGLCACFVLTKLLHDRWNSDANDPSHNNRLHGEQIHDDVAIVVASQVGDNTTWLDSFEAWPRLVYVTDDPSSNPKVPANKGREGMVYLTYIIDHYDQLPETVIFSHSKRYQWHNDDPLYDGQAVLRRLNISYVKSQGYVNLRCVWTLGCPAEIRPLIEATAPEPASDPDSKDARAGSFYKEAFEELFPGSDLPETVGGPCCAQFAVTADTIRERPRAEYQRFRKWLLETPLRDDLSGRILEYSWHIVFGKGPVLCPDAKDCYCRLFGLCGLECEERGVCRAAYTLPTYSTMPDGWPNVDWDDNPRNATKIMVDYEAENMHP